MTVKAEYPRQTSRPTVWLKLGLATIFTLMVVGQLFAFEKFPELLARQLPVFLGDWAQPLTALLVTLEIAAVASLVWVKLSPLARWCGSLAALLVPTVWYLIVFSGMSKIRPLNSGILGTKVELQASFWLLTVLVVLFGLAVVATRQNWRLPDNSRSMSRSAKPTRKTSSAK